MKKAEYFQVAVLSLIILVSLTLASQKVLTQNPGRLLAAISGAGSGLVAHWTFDEGAGSAAGDTASGNNGTLTNGPAWTTGKIGTGALSFDGVNDSVDVGNPSALNFDRNTPFSIFMWVNEAQQSIPTEGYYGLMKKGLDNTYPGWGFGVRDIGYYEMNLFNTTQDGGLFIRWPRASTGAWHLVGFTYDGSSSSAGMTTYVDGVAVSKVVNRDDLNSGTIATAGPLKIGAAYAPNTYLFKGMLDDVRIYNRALTPQDVSELYALGDGVPVGGGPTPTNGSCSVNLNQCAAGTFSDQADTATNSLWQCVGSNGGTTASCSLPVTQNPTPVNGQCSATVNSCTAGNFSDQTDTSTQQLWQCTGISGGTTASCSVAIDPPPTTYTPYTGPAPVIGSSALVPFPTSGLWNRSVNFIPGNKEVVMSNPPLFSWPYDPTTSYIEYSPNRTFILQVDNNSDFSSPILNIETEYNVYAFAPNQFSAGTTYYWRVGYKTVSAPSPVWKCTTCSFTISPSATNWDRSFLSDSTYVQSKIGPAAHPFLLFNKTNRKALYTYLANSTNNDGNNTATSWTTLKSNADRDISSTWWGKAAPGIDASTWAEGIKNAAFVWQLTEEAPVGSADAALNARIEAKLPEQQLIYLSKWIVANNYWMEDVVSNSGYDTIPNMAFAYDWLYERFANETDRAEARKAIIYFASWVHDYSYRDNGIKIATNGTTWQSNPEAYNGDYQVLPGSLLKAGHSHTLDNFYAALRGVVAVAGESAKAKKIMDFGINYLLLKGTPFTFDNGGITEGRSYGPGSSHALLANILYQFAFPEVPFTKNPRLLNGFEWSSRMNPIGMTEIHEPWGEGLNYTDFMKSIDARNATMFLQSGPLAQHYKTAYPYSLSKVFSDINLVLPKYYPMPGQSARTSALSKLMIQDGWALGCSAHTNTSSCYSNGTGFIFQAKPAGQTSHGSYSDLSYQLWAYGSTITDAGGAYHSAIGSTPYSQYTLAINGYGQAQSLHVQMSPFYSRFFGYNQGSNYTYVSADATNAYPRTPFAVFGMDTTPASYRNLHGTGPLKDLQKVQRHFLHVKNKYFVVFDDLASAIDSTYSSLYHIPTGNPTFENSEKTAFTYTVGGVKVRVAQIYNPTGLKVDDQTGANLYVNPIIPSENYSFTGGDTTPRTHALWFSNETKQKKFQFITVIYPENPTVATAARIERVDDYTVKITNQDGSVDVISFNPMTAAANGATLVVDPYQLTPLPVTDDVTGTTVTGIPYVPPTTPPAPTAVNGVCSTTINQCTAGTLSDQADTATSALWQCAGSNGGTTASCSLPLGTAYKQGDFNKDGYVNTIDFSYMNSNWNTNDASADLNKDGTVNTLDYTIMVKNWTN